MATLPVRFHFSYRDVDGNSVTTTIADGDIPDATTLATLTGTSAALAAVLSPLTNAKLVRRSFAVLADAAQGVGIDAEFPLVSQKATLHFSNAAGSRSSVSIPAPVETDFRAPPSDDIIDPGAAAVAAFIAFYVAHITDEAGVALNLFQGGALTSRARSRRRSIHS